MLSCRWQLQLTPTHVLQLVARPCVRAGEWICSADADDIMLPRRVELQLAAARAAPPHTLLGCRFVRDPPDATWHYSLWANSTTQHDLWLQQFRECTIVQPTWFYRRSLWESVGAFPCTRAASAAVADGPCDVACFYSSVVGCAA